MKPEADLSIALLQLDLVWENPDANIAAIDVMMRDPQIDSEACDILVLPEMWATGFTMNPAQQGVPWSTSCAHSPETWPAPLHAMQRWSRQHDTAVVGSLSCNLLDEGRCVNRCFFMTPDGLKGWYDKRHLFRFAGEDASYSPGAEHVIIPWRGWNILLQICYDLRFPESSRNDGDSPYDLALYVANWPDVRTSAWKTLLQARAIENQAYVGGVNRIGVDANGINHSGSSAIHHPKGQRIATSARQETHWVCATLSKAELNDYRNRFPVLKDVI
jgi:predicted amidohydrolase